MAPMTSDCRGGARIRPLSGPAAGPGSHQACASRPAAKASMSRPIPAGFKSPTWLCLYCVIGIKINFVPKNFKINFDP
jgi:hypothetical protein